MNPFLGMMVPVMMTMPQGVRRAKRRRVDPRQSDQTGPETVDQVLAPTDHVNVADNEPAFEIDQSDQVQVQVVRADNEAVEPEIQAKLAEACHRTLMDFVWWAAFPVILSLGIHFEIFFSCGLKLTDFN